MFILGLNAYHGDASACLLREGVIVAAAEEERFRRIKHCAGFPSHAIEYCLSEANIALADVTHVAVNSKPTACFFRKIGYAILRGPHPGLVMDRIRNQSKRQSIRSELERAFPRSRFNGRVHRIEHHLAHLASGFLVSPFREATAVSIDGFGDFSSAAWGIGQDSKITVGGRVYFPHSLGLFYQALTQYLGFPHYGDEYKVMGLAPYGKPQYLPQMRSIVYLLADGCYALNRTYFRHESERIEYEWQDGTPHVGNIFSPALEELLGPARKQDEPLTERHRDIARSVQAMYEEAFFHLLNTVQRRHGIKSLTLAGGCAMNSVANGKIRIRTSYTRIYVQSAAGDAGGAIGAAQYVWHGLPESRQHVRTQPASRSLDGDIVPGRYVMEHAYLGPASTGEAISELLNKRGPELADSGCLVQHLDEQDLCLRTARAIALGQVVGWFQGRMEWGPRALGNRSILCDPRRPDMKELLNLKIKRRESFRPFAPSVLREYVGEWFEQDGDVPFMMQVYRVREEKRQLIPAVTHVDGSGRLQTVHRQTNALYWDLINEFLQITGVPMLLNTSFNENEPVVCRPAEALDCFLRTKMDILVLHSTMICRTHGFGAAA
jgi:carbamoyltransferase